MVKHIASVEELEKAFTEAGNKAVLIDFYATWCGPCKVIAPQIEKFALEYPNVIVYKVDVDEADDLAQKEGITAMPTFKVYVKGVQQDMVLGADVKKVEELFIKHNKSH